MMIPRRSFVGLVSLGMVAGAHRSLWADDRKASGQVGADQVAME